MDQKKKEYIFIFLTIIVVAVTIVLLFYPNAGYPYSYVNLQEKRETAEANNEKLIDNEKSISSKRNELEQLEIKKNKIHSEASELKRNINEDDFIMRMPDFLISMEQEAYKNKITLNIAYGEIQTITSSSRGPGWQNYEQDRLNHEQKEDPNTREQQDGKPDENQPNLDGSNEVDGTNNEANENEQGRQNGQDSKSERDAENEQDSKDEENSESEGFTKEEIQNGILYVEGLDVTVIPIQIKGSYHSVRSYIQYLDKIGMIAPSSVVLESEGKKVKGKIILNVFHGEVF